jgi:hypothetical protein
MIPDRKKRIQGKIANLLPSQREELHAWFRENLEYSEIRERLKKKFGVTIAASSLSNYYSRHSFEIMASPPISQGQEIKFVVHIEITPSTGGYEIKQIVNYPSEAK